jgi:ABC-type Fe3+-hydroxamate transport system substrate-binding protein
VRSAALWSGSLLLPLLISCASPQPSASVRVISLAPSLTEIAYAAGCGDKLVGDTTFDDYPAAARSLPHVADLVTVDLERVSALAPTVVLALHDQEHEAAPIASLLHMRVEFLPNRNLNDLFQDVSQVGSACGTQTQARKLAKSLHAELGQLSRSAAAYHDHPKVFFLLDFPGYTAGKYSFLDDLIRLAGGVNVAGNIAQPYPNVSAEWLLEANPDVIIVAREAQFGPDVIARQPWRSLHAVQTGRIIRPPSDDIIERNGPRVVDGLAWLINALHKTRSTPSTRAL